MRLSRPRALVLVGHGEPLENGAQRVTPPLAPIKLRDELLRAPPKTAQDMPCIDEATEALHVRHGVALDVRVGGSLPQDRDEHAVGRIRADGVEDGEGEFALGQVLCQAL